MIPLIKPYYLVLLASLVFVMLFNGFKQFTDGITDTKTAMWILLGGNVLNIIGNYILIYGKLGLPELGLLGAGVIRLQMPWQIAHLPPGAARHYYSYVPAPPPKHEPPHAESATSSSRE